MKKIAGILLILMLIVTFSLSSVVLAADPTDVTVDWDGAGLVTGGVTAGNDVTTGFVTGGSYILGGFTASDQNDNPYGYGVDSYTTHLNAYMENGFVEYQTDRLDSMASMYGVAGQSSYSYLDATGGWCQMHMGSQTNYASMVDPMYGQNRLAGFAHEFEANASAWNIIRKVTASDGDWAGTSALGTGQFTLDTMTSELGANGVRYGQGGGCYTDAEFHATGAGIANFKGVGGNTASFDGLGLATYGDGSTGSASLEVISNWASSFDWVGNHMTVD